MTDRNSRLSRRELYSGTMVIFIGLFYLLTIATAVFQPHFTRFDRGEIKMLLLSAFYLAGGILFLLKKNAGWIMSTSILMNFVFVMMVFIITLSQAGALTTYALMVIFLFILLLMSFLFLFGRDTRRRYQVSNKSYLLVLLLYALVAYINFGL